MKKPSKLLLLQVIFPILSLTGIHWNSNGIPICADAFAEEQILDLAIRAEEALKQPEIHNNAETQHRANDIWTYLSRWETTEQSFPFRHNEFIAFRENVEWLEALLKNPTERTPSETSENFNEIASRQETDHLLNSIVANEITIALNTTYTVRPPNTHEFRVVFLPKIVEMINQNNSNIRVKKSMRALLLGPVNRAKSQAGIKKIASDQHNGLFEIKIQGKKGVGNFRFGIFLYNGIYYIAEYTYHHIERQRAFIDSIHRARLQTIADLNQSH